jgi:hypothetical protein
VLRALVCRRRRRGGSHGSGQVGRSGVPDNLGNRRFEGVEVVRHQLLAGDGGILGGHGQEVGVVLLKRAVLLNGTQGDALSVGVKWGFEGDDEEGLEIVPGGRNGATRVEISDPGSKRGASQLGQDERDLVGAQAVRSSEVKVHADEPGSKTSLSGVALRGSGNDEEWVHDVNKATNQGKARQGKARYGQDKLRGSGGGRERSYQCNKTEVSSLLVKTRNEKTRKEKVELESKQNQDKHEDINNRVELLR